MVPTNNPDRPFSTLFFSVSEFFAESPLKVQLHVASLGKSLDLNRSGNFVHS